MSIRKSSKWRKATFAEVLKRDGPLCGDCGVENRSICVPRGEGWSDGGPRFSLVFFRTLLELEHVVPLHLGGGNELENLRLLCPPCHRKKTSAEQSARLRALGAGRNAVAHA